MTPLRNIAVAAALALSVSGGPAATAAAPQAKAPKPAAPPPPGAKTPPPPGLLLYNRALEAAAAGKTEEAIRLCRRVLKDEPDAAAVWATLAQLLAEAGRADEALAAITKATAAAPDAATFWAARANLETRARRWDAAIASAGKALKGEPRSDPALAALATAYLQKKRFKEAVPVLRRLSSARGGLDPAVGQNLVLALVQSGDERGALDVARKVAAKYPDLPEAHLAVADLSARAGNYAGAYEALAAARRLKPGDFTIDLNLALAAEQRGRPDEALSLLADLAKAHPAAGAPWFHRGRILYADEKLPGRFAKAEAAFAQAVEREPKRGLYRANLGLAQMFQGATRAEDAKASFARALADDPRAEAAHLGLAYLAENARQWGEAAGHYESVLRVNPAQHFARRRRAGALYAAGRKDDAYREFWELASRDAKDAARHLKELGSLLQSDGKYATARSAYAQALERAPGDLTALVGMGQTYEKERNFPAAERQYRAAIAADPKFTDGYLLLGELLQKTRRTGDKIALMEQWLAAEPTSNQARWELSQLYREQGRDEDALREMRRLTLRKGDPNRLNYRLGPAALYLEREKWAQAAAEAEKVLAEEPDADDVRYLLARAYEGMGRIEDAEKLLRAAEGRAQEPPQKTRAKLALAGLYERAKRYPEARTLYEDVLGADPAQVAAMQGLARAGAETGEPDAAARYLERLATASPDTPDLRAAASLEYFLTQGAKTDYQGYVAFAKRLAQKYPASAEAKARAEQAVNRYGGGGGGTAPSVPPAGNPPTPR